MFVVLLLVLVNAVGIKGEERAAIVKEIVYELSQNASNLFMKDIDCSSIIMDMTQDSFYTSCTGNSSADHLLNSTIILQFDWEVNTNSDTRCSCGLFLLQLMLPFNVYDSTFCETNSTYSCTNICEDHNNSKTCSSSPYDLTECVTRNKECLLHYRNVYFTQLTSGKQALLIVVVRGLKCQIFRDYLNDICDQLFDIPTTQSTEGKSTQNRHIVLSVWLTTGLICVILITGGIVTIVCITGCAIKKRRQDVGPSTTNQSNLALQLTSTYNIDFNQYEKVFESVLVQPSDYTFTGELGEGTFGIVYKGVFRQTSNIETDVAIKTLKENPNSDQVKEFISESAIMLDFDHPNVLKLLGVCFDHQLPLIILPYMANGDLKNYLITARGEEDDMLPKELNMKILTNMCLDVVKGMKYLAEMKFVHRDLAARNCMVSEELKVKIADFGFSRDIYDQDYYRLERKARLPVKWLPAESLYDNFYSEKTDVWSFGVVCWEVYSLGRIPYPGLDNADIPDYISKGNRLKKPSLCTDEIYDIMKQCWNHKPMDRPTFKCLLPLLEAVLSSEQTENPLHLKERPYFTLEPPSQESIIHTQKESSGSE